MLCLTARVTTLGSIECMTHVSLDSVNKLVLEPGDGAVSVCPCLDAESVPDFPGVPRDE